MGADDQRVMAKHRVGRSDFIAATLVLSAGAVAWWSGVGDRSSPGHEAGTPVTVAQEAESETRTGPRMADGLLPTRLVIPAIELDEPIVEVGVVERDGSLEWETARNAVGHHIDSARPGQPGNMVLSGHVSVASASDRAVFRSLAMLRVGDDLQVWAGDEAHRYVVSDIAVVSPDSVKLLRSGVATEVTLITCTADLQGRLIVKGVHADL